MSHLISKKKMKPAYFAALKDKPQRRRVFNKHASRWQYGMKGKQPGKIIQVDHLSIYRNSACIKHVDIKSIQVDGGCGFMKDFEKICGELGLNLLVLPTRSPKYNGQIERCNGITRDDFHSQYNDVFQVEGIYNNIR